VEYPVIIDGRRTGTLKVFRQGLYTVYQARAEKSKELLRLSVYGADREGCLGLMQPRGDFLWLERRLSRAAQRDFPPRIEYAGRAGEKKAEPRPAGGDIIWYRQKNGTLSASSGGRQLVAIPVKEGLGLGTRYIDGREYAVFFY